MRILLILIIAFNAVSCLEEGTTRNAKFVKGDNVPRKIIPQEEILKNVRYYIRMNNLQPDRHYILVQLDGTSRKIIKITSSNTALYKSSRFPSHYFLVDDFIVFFFSEIDYLLERAELKDYEFYQKLFIEQGINNLDSLSRLDHPPVWYMMKCVNQDSFKLYKSGFQHFSYYLPCGYVLKRGEGDDFDSLWVVKE